MAVDNSYQPAIYKEQGGNKLVIKSTGTVEVTSGATVTGLVPATGALANGVYNITVTDGVAAWTLVE